MTVDTLYVTDLDGTLLRPDKTISPQTARILNSLDSLPLTVATARTPYGALPLLKDVRFRLPLILQNGSILYDSERGRIVRAQCLEPDAYAGVCAAARESGVNGFAYCLDGDTLRCCYTELTTEDMREVYEERTRAFPGSFLKVRNLADLSDHNPVYFSLNAPFSVIEPFAERLRATEGISFVRYRDVYRTDIWYLEVSAPEATKYHGILRLREMTGARRVVGFGDNENDFGLFDACDEKIAVANASEKLKVRADTIIGANTEDAVALCLLERTRGSNLQHPKEQGT